MDTSSKIAKNIRHFREMKNLKQSFMAERLDIDTRSAL
jgi:transcriptional regulator with XRE-family HTH domain